MNKQNRNRLIDTGTFWQLPGKRGHGGSGEKAEGIKNTN